MADEAKKPAKKPAPKAPTVKVGDVISDGKRGFLKKGDPLPAGCDVAALKAKGLI